MIMGNAEQPEYKLVKTNGNIEIRDYPPMILAEVEVSGERKEAIKEGFKILADYIFGNNTSIQKNDITQSTAKEVNEKISMTAPVMQQKHKDTWKVRFIMPKMFSMETLPRPNSEMIQLIPVQSKRFAAIRFSGIASEGNIECYTNELKDYISAENLEAIGGVILAFYNPPWTLPFFRRNEIMIEISKSLFT